MSEYKVEKGIRIPPSDLRRKNAVFPLAELEVKDSFLIPLDTQDEALVKKHIWRVTSAIAYYKKKHGGKFAIRKIKGQGVRVWRIA